MRAIVGLAILVILLGVGVAFVVAPSDAPSEPQYKISTDESPRIDLEKYWSNLADADAGKAFRAILGFTKTPKASVAFLGEKLKSIPAPETTEIKRLIADLDSGSFSVREKAKLDLLKLGAFADAGLRQSFTANPTLETRRRMEELLVRLTGPVSDMNYLRAIRTIESLERIGTDEAKALLNQYAAGPPEAFLTQDAIEAVRRLQAFARVDPPLRPTKVDLYGDAVPAGALGRLGSIRFRRDVNYGAMCPEFVFLPNGKALLYLEDHHMRMWEVPSGRVLCDTNVKPMYITSSALANDGRELVIAGFRPPVHTSGVGEIRVYSMPSGNLIKTFSNRASDYVKSAFFRDGMRVLTIDDVGRAVRVDDIASGKELSRINLPFKPDIKLPNMALSPDGSYVAVSAGLKPTRLHAPWEEIKLYLWKWQDDKPRPIAELEGRPMRRVVFSPDARFLAGITGDNNLLVWEVPSGRLLFELKPSEKDGYVAAAGMVFTPDGKALALPIGGNNTTGRIQFLDPRTGRLQKTIVAGYLGYRTAYHLTFSPDMQTLAVSTDLGARLWELATGKEIRTIEGAHQGEVSHVIAPDHDTLLTASADGTIRVWEAATTKQVARLPLGDASNGFIALSPDCRLLAASSYSSAIHIWDVKTGEEKMRLRDQEKLNDVRALGFLPDSRCLFSWTRDGRRLCLWDMDTGMLRLEHTTGAQGNTTFLFAKAALSLDGKTLFVTGADGFHLFDTASGREAHIPLNTNVEFRSVSISRNRRYALLSACDVKDGYKPAIYVVDILSRQIAQHIRLPGLYSGAVAFSVDGRMFAAAANGVDDTKSTICVYETASGKLRGSIGSSSGTSSVAFLPDCNRLAFGLEDSTVLIWDLSAPAFSERQN